MKIGKIVFGIFAMVALGALAMAGGDPLSNSGTESGQTVTSTMQAYRWIAALVPLGAGVLAVSHRLKKLKEEEEEGRHHPSLSKYGSLFLFFLIGVGAMFLIYGVFGFIFAGQNFTDTWNSLVVNPLWKSVIGQ